MRKIVLALFTIFSLAGSAQSFNELFCDSTLRIDYIFAGDCHSQEISTEKLNLIPGWQTSRGRERTDNSEEPQHEACGLPQLFLYTLPGMVVVR